MTDPMDPYRASDPYQQSDPYRAVDPYQTPGPPAPPVSGTPATAPLPTPYAPPPAAYPAYGPAVSGAGTHGYDPATGQPMSDKSKIVAGLLQIVPGFLFTLGGIGRLYTGNTSLGVAQLVASVVGWSAFWCGFVLGFPFGLWFGIWVWFIVDGILLMAGRSVDGQGRLLRS
jgi:drug/metabolite transporter (DMT)-like permease